jgi:hypothetical protein
MTTRILPPQEWARILTTGCLVDKSWAAKATHGAVVVVEVQERIIGTAFIFRTTEDTQTHIDGLWIAEPYRGKMRVQRSLYRYLQDLTIHFGGPRQIDMSGAAQWLQPRARRRHGVRL